MNPEMSDPVEIAVYCRVKLAEVALDQYLTRRDVRKLDLAEYHLNAAAAEVRDSGRKNSEDGLPDAGGLAARAYRVVSSEVAHARIAWRNS